MHLQNQEMHVSICFHFVSLVEKSNTPFPFALNFNVSVLLVVTYLKERHLWPSYPFSYHSFDKLFGTLLQKLISIAPFLTMSSQSLPYFPLLFVILLFQLHILNHLACPTNRSDCIALTISKDTTDSLGMVKISLAWPESGYCLLYIQRPLILPIFFKV